MRTLLFTPAYNEESSVPVVVTELRREFPGCDVLVIDDGSTDDTAARARAAGATVVSLPFNQGVGAALQTAYMYADRHGYDACGRVDSDGQHPAAELRTLLELIWTGHADYVVGSRFHSAGAGSYRPGPIRRLGIGLFRTLLSLTAGTRLTDVTSGMHAASARVIHLFSAYHHPDYPELELLQLAISHSLRVRELQVSMRPRTAGRSKITPLRSVYFAFKALLVIPIGSLRAVDATRSSDRRAS